MIHEEEPSEEDLKQIEEEQCPTCHNTGLVDCDEWDEDLGRMVNNGVMKCPECGDYD
jgi:hypothetical protein